MELLLKLFGGETEGFACDVTAGGGGLVEVGRPVDEFLWYVAELGLVSFEFSSESIIGSSRSCK